MKQYIENKLRRMAFPSVITALTIVCLTVSAIAAYCTWRIFFGVEVLKTLFLLLGGLLLGFFVFIVCAVLSGVVIAALWRPIKNVLAKLSPETPPIAVSPPVFSSPGPAQPKPAGTEKRHASPRATCRSRRLDLGGRMNFPK